MRASFRRNKVPAGRHKLLKRGQLQIWEIILTEVLVKTKKKRKGLHHNWSWFQICRSHLRDIIETKLSDGFIEPRAGFKSSRA